MLGILLAAAPAAQAKPNALVQLVPFLFIFVIFYFLIIVPNKKKQKAHQNLLDNIKVHDMVITSGGIIGKVVTIKKEKNTVLIRIDDTTNAKMEVQKSAIAGVINESKETKPAAS